MKAPIASEHDQECTTQTFWIEDRAPRLRALARYQTALGAAEIGKPQKLKESVRQGTYFCTSH